MGKSYPALDDRLIEFIKQQHVFFVGTAPLRADGLLNLSPKGLDCLAVLDPHTVAYLDLTGSGIETVSHLRENGRIVLMFCAFDGPPKIVRLHGRGQVFQPGDEEFRALIGRFPTYPATRSVIRVAIQRIGDSCGFGVPVMRYEHDRDQMGQWAERKGSEGITAYQREKNLVSLDGLPGLRVT